MADPGPMTLADLLAVRPHGKRRMPTGERMVQFRWAERDGSVWLFPAALLGQSGGLGLLRAGGRWRTGERPVGTQFAYWLAVAARQDVWRSLRGVPGLMPAVRVTPAEDRLGVLVDLGAVLPARRASPAIVSALDDMFQPRRLGAWTEFAHSKAERATA